MDALSGGGASFVCGRAYMSNDGVLAPTFFPITSALVQYAGKKCCRRWAVCEKWFETRVSSWLQMTLARNVNSNRGGHSSIPNITYGTYAECTISNVTHDLSPTYDRLVEWPGYWSLLVNEHKGWKSWAYCVTERTYKHFITRWQEKSSRLLHCFLENYRVTCSTCSAGAYKSIGKLKLTMLPNQCRDSRINKALQSMRKLPK